MSEIKKNAPSVPSYTPLPDLPKTEEERSRCLELANMLLGLNYAVIHRYRMLSSEEDRINFYEIFEEKSGDLYKALNINCPCGKCANGRCCACP